MSADKIQTSKIDAPVRCLVIQLARLGDTIQSLMALKAAKQLYPHLQITFVARERYAQAAKKVSWIDEVVVLPTEEILSPILVENRTGESLKRLAQWVKPLVQEPWDFLVNWTYSDASSYLAGLIPALVKVGYTRKTDTVFRCADDWSRYVQAIVQGKINQNIHLTDIFTTQILTVLQIHMGEPENRGNEPITSKSFFDKECSPSVRAELSEVGASYRWIGIQLGAGRSDKVWSTENWIELATCLLENQPQHRIALLGGPEDQDRARILMTTLKERDESYLTRVVSFVGRTDFDLWTEIVARCNWIIAGDTAVVHLASVLGTRVLNLSIGDVRLEETGPYGNGHYVISSRNPAQDLSPTCVYAAWSFANRDWNLKSIDSASLKRHFNTLGVLEHVTKIRLFRSKIRPLTEGGGVVFEPIMDVPMDVTEWLSLVMGQVARSWYCGWVAPVGSELKKKTIHSKLLRNLRDLDEGSEVLARIFEQAASTAALLAEHSARLRSDKIMSVEDRQKIQRLARRLMRYDRLIERLSKLHMSFRGFHQMLKVMMHNLEGNTLAELGRESSDSYKLIANGIRVFRDWLNHTVKLARPAVVSQPAVVSFSQEKSVE